MQAHVLHMRFVCHAGTAMSDSDEAAMYALMERAEAIAKASGLEPEAALQQARSEQQLWQSSHAQQQQPQPELELNGPSTETASALLKNEPVNPKQPSAISIAQEPSSSSSSTRISTDTNVLPSEQSQGQPPEAGSANSPIIPLPHVQSQSSKSAASRSKQGSWTGLRRGFLAPKPNQTASTAQQTSKSIHSPSAEAAGSAGAQDSPIQQVPDAAAAAAAPSFTGRVLERGRQDGELHSGTTKGKSEIAGMHASMDTARTAADASVSDSHEDGLSQPGAESDAPQKRVSRFKAARTSQ